MTLAIVHNVAHYALLKLFDVMHQSMKAPVDFKQAFHLAELQHSRP